MTEPQQTIRIQTPKGEFIALSLNTDGSVTWETYRASVYAAHDEEPYAPKPTENEEK